MDDMEMWGYLTEQSQRKVIRMNEAGLEITDTDNYFGRPVLGKILILPRRDAQQFKHDKPWACISISDSYEIFDADILEDNRVAILRLKFDDISREKPGHKTIDKRQAQQIMSFAEQVWDKVDILMIHCNAGLCRSPACGQVISEKYQPEFASYFEDLYHPNELVVKTLRAG
jgi:predicted protein tyrosine phosphatase